jgi:hypothetical protein
MNPLWSKKQKHGAQSENGAKVPPIEYEKAVEAEQQVTIHGRRG